MKKIAIILVVSILCSILGVTNEAELRVKAANPASTGTRPKGNIKITAKTLNVREEKSTESKVLSTVHLGEIYEVLDDGKDSQGRVWYHVKAEFGVTGWVAGWYCTKTKESINTTIESQPGKLLINCTKEALFIKLLLLEDYSLTKVLKVCGNNYIKYPYNNYTNYKYSNGTVVEVNEENKVISIKVGGRTFYVNEVQKIKGNILENPGNEMVILNGDYLLIIEARTKKIIREYDTGYLYVDEFCVGNFVGDSKLELYLNGWGDAVMKNNIYGVVNDQFIRTFHMESFQEYGEGINAKIEKSKLKLDINVDDFSASETSVLPERVFYDTKDTKDKNQLLSVDPDWKVEKVNGKWYIKLHYTVNLVMINFYWGPPGVDTQDNEKMYNDIATIDIILDLHNKHPKIERINYAVKYNDPKLNQVEPLLYDEAVIVNGPALGMSMEEAYKTLGGDFDKEEYSEYKELNGVGLFEFCAQVVRIYVESPKYETTRGLKVGDDIQKVESLYGKPDVGFSGDAYVEYKFCNEDQKGQLSLSYYRTLTIYYKNGIVSAYVFDQVILD